MSNLNINTTIKNSTSPTINITNAITTTIAPVTTLPATIQVGQVVKPRVSLTYRLFKVEFKDLAIMQGASLRNVDLEDKVDDLLLSYFLVGKAVMETHSKAIFAFMTLCKSTHTLFLECIIQRNVFIETFRYAYKNVFKLYPIACSFNTQNFNDKLMPLIIQGLDCNDTQFCLFQLTKKFQEKFQEYLNSDFSLIPNFASSIMDTVTTLKQIIKIEQANCLVDYILYDISDALSKCNNQGTKNTNDRRLMALYLLGGLVKEECLHGKSDLTLEMKLINKIEELISNDKGQLQAIALCTIGALSKAGLCLDKVKDSINSILVTTLALLSNASMGVVSFEEGAPLYALCAFARAGLLKGLNDVILLGNNCKEAKKLLACKSIDILSQALKMFTAFAQEGLLKDLNDDTLINGIGNDANGLLSHSDNEIVQQALEMLVAFFEANMLQGLEIKILEGIGDNLEALGPRSINDFKENIMKLCKIVVERAKVGLLKDLVPNDLCKIATKTMSLLAHVDQGVASNALLIMGYFQDMGIINVILVYNTISTVIVLEKNESEQEEWQEMYSEINDLKNIDMSLLKSLDFSMIETQLTQIISFIDHSHKEVVKIALSIINLFTDLNLFDKDKHSLLIGDCFMKIQQLLAQNDPEAVLVGLNILAKFAQAGLLMDQHFIDLNDSLQKIDYTILQNELTRVAKVFKRALGDADLAMALDINQEMAILTLFSKADLLKDSAEFAAIGSQLCDVVTVRWEIEAIRKS